MCAPLCILYGCFLILRAPVHVQVDTLFTEALLHFLYCWKGHIIVSLALFATERGRGTCRSLLGCNASCCLPRGGRDRADALGAQLSVPFRQKYLDYDCRRRLDTGRISPLFAQQSSKRQQLRDYAPHQGCMVARQVCSPRQVAFRQSVLLSPVLADDSSKEPLEFRRLLRALCAGCCFC